MPFLTLPIALATTAVNMAIGSATIVHAATTNITGYCRGNVSDNVFTLTANCDTTSTLTVPNGYTLNGAGYTITAHDPDSTDLPAGAFHGPVLTNAGTTMNLTNLTVRGTGFAFNCDPVNPTVGILLSNASGTMTNVDVPDITQHTDCLTVHSIQIRSDTDPQTVELDHVTVTDFQRTGLLIQGKETVDVTNSAFGPPDPRVPNPGKLAQNTVQFGSPALAGPTTGTFTNNAVAGGAFGVASNVSAALLIYGVTGLDVTHNTFSGKGTDVGINMSNSSDVTLAYNAINREPTPPGFADTYGIGANSDDTTRETAKLICNSFAGWNLNLGNLTQKPCILSATTVPCATIDEPSNIKLEALTQNPEADLTWRLISGELPPGLTLAPDGTISGTPTQITQTNATLAVTDPVDGTTTADFTFCVERPAPPTPPTPKPAHPKPAHHRELAATGTSDAPYAMLALALITAGATLVTRKRSAQRRMTPHTNPARNP